MFFGTKIFWTPNFFYTKNLFGPKMCLDPKTVGPNIFKSEFIEYYITENKSLSTKVLHELEMVKTRKYMIEI